MTDKDLIKKLRKLDKISPSRQWMGSLRRSLVAQIDYEMIREGNSGFNFFGGWLNRVQPMALAVSLSLIIVFGPWLALKASEPSLPGELLYTIKRAGEDIQKTIASNGEKTKLEVEFASRRLEELAKISQDSSEEKDEKAKEVIIDFKDSLAGVSHYVKGISSKEDAVAVAKKTKKIKEDLEKTKSDVPLLEDEIAEAEKTIEMISQDILTVLTAKNDESSEEEIATTTGIIDEEILIFLETVTSTDRELEK